MAFQWHDLSSWSRGDVDRTPKTWQVRVGLFRLIVTRRHGLEGWFIEFADQFNYRKLNNIEIEKAKEEAIVLVRDVLSSALVDIEK